MPPRPGAPVAPGDRRASGTRRCTSTRWTRKVPGRAGPRRRADLPQPRLPRRHPRRARLDLRHLRGGHQDQLRAVPAALAVPLRGARRPGRSTPRRWSSPSRARTCCSWTTPNIRLDERPAQAVRAARAARGAVRARSASTPRRRPDDTTGRPDVTGRTSGVDAFWWTLAEFCAGELLPYVFADAEDERNQYTMVVHQVAARLRADAAPAGTDGAVAIDGDTCRTYDDLVDFIVDRLTDDDTRPQWAGPVDRHRHGQRVHPPAAVVAEAAARAHPRRPARHRAARQIVHRRPAGHRRRPAQPAGAGAAVRGRRGARAPRPPARRRPGPAGCCSR